MLTKLSASSARSSARPITILRSFRRQRARFRIDEILSATGRISSLLRTLAEIRQRAEGLALFHAVNLIIEQTQFAPALARIARDGVRDLARELDALLAQTAEAEANGMILAEFAEQLTKRFRDAARVVFPPTTTRIQLITTYKAKARMAGGDRAIPRARAAAALAALSAFRENTHGWRTDYRVRQTRQIEGFERRDRAAQKQELERLLYVAATRARHALVVVLDQEIFTNNDGQLPRTAPTSPADSRQGFLFRRIRPTQQHDR